MDSEQKCTISISAFGPFGDVLNNPTMELLKNLPEKTKLAYNVVLADILEVSTKACDAHVGNVCKLTDICPAVVNLHFGVYAGSSQIQMERCGYNLKHFSIPDVLGYQPMNERIDKDGRKNEPLFTKLNIDGLLTNMKQRGFKKLSTSNDPGRYICNYMYFTSL
jgi:pyroglutamyl-peptidase